MSLKFCIRCNQRKKTNCFPRDKSRKNGFYPYCILCKRKKEKDLYKNSAKRRKDIKEKNKRSRKRNKKLKEEYLEDKKCIDCGNKDYRVLDFDHIKGEKKNNVSALIKGSYSWELILKEILKCEIRCSNCHRIKTHYNAV